MLFHLKSLSSRPFNSPFCVVLTPGRELAEQIFDVAEKLCADINVNVRLEQGGHIRYAGLQSHHQLIHFITCPLFLEDERSCMAIVSKQTYWSEAWAASRKCSAQTSSAETIFLQLSSTKQTLLWTLPFVKRLRVSWRIWRAQEIRNLSLVIK